MGIGKGNLITFEGIEGSGKSTQLNEVYKFLKKRKIKCIKTREPGGTKLAEKIRELIIDIPVKISKLRVKGRGRLDRFDKYGEKKLNKLRKSFTNLTKKHNRIIKIDGTKNKKDITIKIVNYLIKKNVIKNFK